MKKYILNKLVSKHSVIADLLIVLSMMLVCSSYNLELARLEILNSIVPNTDVFVRGALFIMMFVVFGWMGLINGSTHRFGYLGGVFGLLLVPTIGLFVTSGIEFMNPVVKFADFYFRLIAQWPFLSLNGGDYNTPEQIYTGVMILLVLTFVTFILGGKIKSLLEKNPTSAKYLKKE